jgi:hypothetical protein
MSNSDEIFELNYIKIDSKNDVRILDDKDYELETCKFMTTVTEFGEAIIDKNILAYIKKLIPELPINQLIKQNIEYFKQNFKSINSEKKNLYASINDILSTDYKNQFIFNKINLQNVCRVLVHTLPELKKYKISTYKDLKSVINNLNFEKYNFFEAYSNKDYLKNKEKEKQNEKCSGSLSSKSTLSKSKSISSISLKELFEEIIDYNENFENYINLLSKNCNESKGIYYIDYKNKNIICSSMLDNNYIQDNYINIILTKESFIYPQMNQKANINLKKIELPIELILLLYKLRNVNCLIFQINNIDAEFKSMAIFILANIRWLFTNGIEEVKFDLGNEKIFQEINNIFNEYSSDLNYSENKPRNIFHNLGKNNPRSMNCWEPEGDIFYNHKNLKSNFFGKNKEYIYHLQFNPYISTFDNYLCNIYNEIGNLTNFKYIFPINCKINNIQEESDDYDCLTDDSGSFINIEQISISSDNIIIEKETSNVKNKKKKIKKVRTEPINVENQLNLLCTKYKNDFEIIFIYSYFFTVNLKKIKKLNLFFNTPFSYEICKVFNSSQGIEQSNFLTFTNEMESLSEVEFSFNALDSRAFQNILGIINKNSSLSSLKISYFTSDINYFNNN